MARSKRPVLRADELHEVTPALREAFVTPGPHESERAAIRARQIQKLRLLRSRLHGRVLHTRSANGWLLFFFGEIGPLSELDMLEFARARSYEWDDWAPSVDPIAYAITAQLQILMNLLYDEGVTETDSWPRCPRFIRGYQGPHRRELPHGKVLGLTQAQIAWIAERLLSGEAPIQGPCGSDAARLWQAIRDRNLGSRSARTLEDQYAVLCCACLRAWVQEGGLRNAIFSLIARVAPDIWTAGHNPILLLEAAYRI